MGLATSAAGGFPFGSGTPLPSAAPAFGPFGSPWLNSASRDYEIDPNTRQLKQMPTIRQRVFFTLATTRGTMAADIAFGVQLPPVINSSWEAQAEQEIRSGFIQMTDVEKVIRIDLITFAFFTAGRVQTTVQYTDLTTGIADQTVIV